MADATRILTTVDPALPVDANDLAEAIDALSACALTCTTCADACLGEADVASMRDCIRACLACADLCETAARALSRTGACDEPVLRNVLEAVAKACSTCGDTCEGHAEHHKHCRVCAEACRRCEQAVQRILTGLAASVG